MYNKFRQHILRNKQIRIGDMRELIQELESYDTFDIMTTLFDLVTIERTYIRAKQRMKDQIAEALNSELRWRETGEPVVVDELFFEAMGFGKYQDLTAFKRKLRSKATTSDELSAIWAKLRLELRIMEREVVV